MIEIRSERPKNREHFSRLLEFCKDVVAVCNDLGIEPVLTGSLAVSGYAQSQAMEVNDVDLACSELEFPKLSRALNVSAIAIYRELGYAQIAGTISMGKTLE